MKARSIGVAGLIFLLGATFTATAQEFSKPVIKVLPTTKPHTLKLLVAENDGHSVGVRFYSDEGAIAKDEILATKAGNGFLKRYNFQKLTEKAFWMEVKTVHASVLYRITKRGNQGIDAQLEATTYTYPVVAAR